MSGLGYNELRHLADSWGLVFMAVTFLVLVGFALRPGAKKHHRHAANMIFEQEENRG